MSDKAPAAKSKFSVKGKTGGMPGDMGLADAGPGGENYPAPNLSPTPRTPGTEYAADADRVPNPTGRLVIPEGS